MKNYYNILEINQEASDQQIKASYRKLAKTYHPDAGGDSEKFKEIVEAYNVLSDPKKKKEYDFKRQHLTNPNQNPFFNEMFSNIFGRGMKPNIENLDIIIEHIISVKKLFNGTKETVNYKRRLFGSNEQEIITQENIEIDIKKGSQNKDLQFVFSGAGHQSKRTRGFFGNLIIIVRILDEPPIFIRHGVNIVSEIPIPLNLALVGTKIKIPTLHGLKQVLVTSHDCFFNRNPVVLKGCGLQRGINSNSYGDHLLYFGVETPQTLTEEQKKFFKEMPTTEDVYPGYNKIIKLAE